MLSFFTKLHRRNGLLCLLLCAAFSTQGQKLPVATAPDIKFGRVSANDLQVDPYPQDTTAEAIVLYDYADFRIELVTSSLWMVTRYHIRTKIRKKSAYDRATIAKSLRRGIGGQTEYISNLEGYTYNLVNGAVVTSKLDKSGIFNEKMTDEVTMQKFALPNVREGAIIEYQYTVHTPFAVTQNPNTWSFQQHVPVLWSEFNALIPNYFYYKIITNGYLPLAVSEREGTTCSLLPGRPAEQAMRYRFAVKDAPAFRNEAYITTESDYLSKIDFELASYTFPDEGTHNFSVGWEAMQTTLLREPTFGNQCKRASFLRDVAELIKQQHPDSLGRIKAACAYISHTMKWDGSNGLTSGSTKKAWEARKGDAGDINLLLIGLLRELDFDANPVILSTRSHGRINESFALLRKFNYVIAQIDMGGKDLLLDATDPYLKPGMLPRHCLNGTGRLVHFTKGRFVSLAPAERIAEVTAAVFTLDDEGELKGMMQQSYGGYKALTERKSFLTDGQKNYLDEVRKRKVAWQIEQAGISNADSIAKPFTVDYKLTIPEACQIAGDRIYLRPMLTEGHNEHMFKEPERRYPVDFGAPIDETYTATFTLPKGVTVEEMPKGTIISLPDNAGKFIYQVSAVDNELKVVSRISLRKPVYYAEEYPLLREFYEKILAKHAEQVVMKRTTIADKK